MRRFPLAAMILLIAGSALAQNAAPDTKSEARSRFQQGLALAQAGDLTAALSAFEAAYDAVPHYSVLYNIGQANSTLGRSVEAAAAFERYLADGGGLVSEARRREVAALLETARERIGYLTVVVVGSGDTRVWLDGTELSRERWGFPLALAAGGHSLIVVSSAGPAESRQVMIVGKANVTARFSAEAHRSGTQGWLGVSCDVPGVTVEVAGMPHAETPIGAPLLVVAGPLTVRFSREGYLSRDQQIFVRASRLNEVRCSQLLRAALRPDDLAQLVVKLTPIDAEISVDGERFLGEKLPKGQHVVRVARDGYASVERIVRLFGGKVTSLSVTLLPTRAQLARERAASTKRRTIGITLAAVGAAAAAGGAGLYVWNSRRFDDWRSIRPAGMDSDTAASIQRVDDGAIGLMILGGGLTLGGSWFLFAGD